MVDFTYPPSKLLGEGEIGGKRKYETSKEMF